MAIIRLNNADKIVLIDDCMYDELNRYKWYLSKYRNYATRSHTAKGKKNTIYMHRIILGLSFKDKKHSDHINGNGLDNRFSNLRICTNQQNMYNKGISSRNTSGFKGVCWKTRDEKWESKITKEGKRIALGHYDCPVEAAKSYNKAAIKYHGKFAKLNEIPKGKEV